MSSQRKPISNDLCIEQYMHCQQCLQEMPSGVSPRDWALNEVGFSEIGLQVWCRRHECNVLHIDFEGQKHPANTTRKRGTPDGPRQSQ